MPLAISLAVWRLQAVPPATSAPPWRDAYRAGEFEKAADLLHEVITDFDALQSGDPEP
jgi:hypothetical protein